MSEQKPREQGMTTSVQIQLDSQRQNPSPVIAGDADFLDTQTYRAGAYRLLAALLRDAPDQKVLAQTAELSAAEESGDDLSVALSMLGLSAKHCDPLAIRDEYHTLFIGLGRGELVPYGSWYLTGFLMEKPLGLLRDDLARLGFERTQDTREPEDHIAALCEVMALLIQDHASQDFDGPLATQIEEAQSRFFESHISAWAELFFRDLSDASSAVFYRAVGRLGAEFMAFEKQYLSMTV
jgi:TorA maturation chaperone TorD